MFRLGFGILILAAVHLFPALAPGLRARIIGRVGELTYKGLFALAALAGLLLAINGWKLASIEPLYQPPPWGRYAALLCVLLAFVLLPAPYLANNLRRIVRHPQLTGVLLWGLGHLLANGELRSVTLFGGIAVWSVLQMVLLNRRDGAWSRPQPQPQAWTRDLRLVVLGALLYAGVFYGHAWLFGVAPLPGGS